VFEVHQGAQQETSPRVVLPSDRTGIHTIVIDPGHGGAESGAVSPGGTLEKDLTLALARSLESRLESRLPVRVILTRSQDTDLSLEERTAIANQNKADLFISLHLNSSLGESAYGAETYFLSLEASDEAAAAAARAENAFAGGEPPPSDEGDPLYDLQLMLWDLAQTNHLAESQAFAKLVQQELNTALGLRDRGVKQAPFVVLNGAAMPAVLVEFGFLSNPDEEKKLRDAGHRSELVEAMVRAVSRYRALHTPAAPEPLAEPEVGQ
jgi:N-acetylmuramoyl-L-alanine amidase